MERGRLRFINAELNYWNIGLWIDVAQNRPSTVVETPAVVAAHRHRCKQFLDMRSEVGIAGRGVLHLIRLTRKAPEVVDRPRRGAHGDGFVFDVPVCRHRKYRLRLRQGRADSLPTAAYKSSPAAHSSDSRAQ